MEDRRHPQPDGGFTANITIDGEYRPDAATLGQIADESVRRLGEFAESVVVTARHEVGSPDAPALTQRLTFAAEAGAARRDLVQSQVYLSVLDVADSRRRAVVRLALTAIAPQHDTVLAEFQDFVRTVGLSAGAEA
ncbi:hypothetical protein [Streptomyces nondiastaticus]|uniref:Uncharacterized protein n=1 Tax=Streptomyces nondiastaticus TaxID=3154512 RepID=A0ABW6U5D1_9ACTN